MTAHRHVNMVPVRGVAGSAAGKGVAELGASWTAGVLG